MAQTLADIAIKLSADMVQFENDMGRASRIAKKRSNQMKRDFEVAMKAIAASSIAAGGALAGLVKITANTADNIQKMSQRLGVSTEFLSQYRHVAELSGTSMEKVGDGVRKMSKSINDGNNGLSTAVRAFDSLGISMDTLNSLSPEQQFELIADRISKVESQSVKAGAAMDIFGRSGSELLTVLNAGTDGIAEMRKEADAFGLTISQNAADAAANFNDELTRLQNKVKGMAENLGQSLMPTLTAVIQEMNSTELDSANSNFSILNNTMATLYGAVNLVGLAFEVLGTSAGAAAGIIVAHWDLAVSKMKKTGNDIQALGLSILGTLNPFTDYYKNKLDELSDETTQINMKIFEQSQKAANDMETILSGAADDIDEATKSAFESIFKVFSVANNELNVIPKSTQKAAEGFNDLTKPTGQASAALKDIRNTIKSLRKQHRPIQTMFQELARNMAALNKASLSPDFSDDEFQEGMELLKEQAESAAKDIVDQVEDIYKQIPKLFGESVEEAEKVDFDKMFDGFASSLNPAISALQQFKDEISLIDEMTKSGEFTAGQGAFYKTGLAAEFALNSMASMAEEGSRAQAKLQAAAAITNTILGITAILEQGKGDPYTAFARMAAMAAMVASMGVQIAGAFGGSGAGSAEQRQARQGTGTVLGDDSAKSESIVNALDMIASASEKIVGINSKMLRSLRTMNDAISGTVNQIAQTGEIGNLGTQSGGFGGFGGTGITQFFEGILFGKSKITDRGIEILSGSISDAINGDLFQAYEIARRKGIFGSSSRTNTAALEEGVTNQISLIFESMSDAILAGAEALGVNVPDVQAALDAYQIEEQRISLMDLSPDEQRAELQAVFSSIFDGLTAFSIPFITQFQEAGEGLGETLARVSTTVLVFEEAIASMGLDFIAKQVDPELFAQAAVAIADFAGGLDEFIDGYSTYVSNFLSEAEQLEIITGRISGVFSDLGLTLPDTREAFTQLIQGLDLTTTAGQEAFGTLIALSGEIDSYYSGLEDSQQRAAQQVQQLADHIAGVLSDMENMDLSPFARSLKDIALQFNENIKVAKKLGASEQELAMIQAYATRQIQAAIRQLENDISGALTDLYGSELDQINEQISLLEQQESQINSVAQANDNRYAAELQAIKNIHGFVDSLLLDSNLSPLNPMEQLSEAQRQFDEMFAAAQSGDIEALQNLPEMARQLLGLRREVFASQDYENFAGGIIDMLSSLGVTSSPSEQNPQTTIIGQNQRLIELQEERNRLEAAFDLEAHRSAVLAVAEQIREWASV
ncbi:MAG: phage tail tape measure protein, partial [Ignavibacteriaceae bacterium]|nr:phage tail tape measure protein [Ignavibacteriaceae bacterium]